MSVRTRAEIRAHLATRTRDSGINDLIDDFVNLTLQEINDPAWAMKGYDHLWSFNKRKHTFDTVASTEFYQLPRDLDKIALIRQTTSPIKLKYYPDEVFYRNIPDPTATGNPVCYRIWEEEGLETRLSTDDTIDIVSSSTSDGSSITVSLTGYDTSGIKRSESLSLNGTTDVPGTITFDAGRPVRVSKSADTVGTITVKEGASDTTLLTIGEHERSPRFKVIGFYPIPASAITISLEYYTRIRRLEHDADVADIDEKWIWVLIAGVLHKIFQYKNKIADSQLAFTNYKNGVVSMIKADTMNVDYIPKLRRNNRYYRVGIYELSDEVFVPWF